MSIAIPDFWKQAVASGLLSAARCKQLHAEFKDSRPAGQAITTLDLAKWLVSTRVLSRDQATALLAGRRVNLSEPQPAAENLPIVNVSPGTTAGPATRRRSSKNSFLGGIVALTVVIGIVFAAVMLSSSGNPPVKSPVLAEKNKVAAEPVSDEKPAEGAKLAPTARSDVTVTEIDDDGQTLWTSPTMGEPLSLSYLPSGTQVILTFRPAELLENAEGARLLEALGPAGQFAREQLQAVLGRDLGEIEQLTLAFYPDESGLPQAAYVMRLREAPAEATQLAAWGHPAAAEHRAKKFFENKRFAYYFPPDEAGRTVAIAQPAAMREILELEGPPLVRREIETLLRKTDAARHFNLLFAPNYLLVDGKSLLAGNLEKLHDPLARFLDESLQAVLVSAHLGEELFLELRALPATDKNPQEVATRLRERLDQVGEQVESHMASLDARPYGRMVINRFPRMVQLLSDFTRSGAEQRQAVLRCYLPLNAAHNLLLGAELTLQEQSVVPQLTTPVASASKQGDAADALRKKITLSFPRDTLERCLEMLGKEIDQEIVILGPDLQLEGITKNQSFGLEELDQPAGEVLRKVLKLANSDGKLVYVIRPKDGRREAIIVTTRSAAAKRGEPLPEEFVRKTETEKP